MEFEVLYNVPSLYAIYANYILIGNIQNCKRYRADTIF